MGCYNYFHHIIRSQLRFRTKIISKDTVKLATIRIQRKFVYYIILSSHSNGLKIKFSYSISCQEMAQMLEKITR